MGQCIVSGRSEMGEAVSEQPKHFEESLQLKTGEAFDEPKNRISSPVDFSFLEIQRKDRTTQRISSATTQAEFPSKSSPITWNRLGFPIHGLPNVGNTCFANAAVLALLHMKEMKEIWERRDSEAARRLLALLDGDRSTETVESLLSHFSEFNDKCQHCAHSFLTALFRHFSVSSATLAKNLSHLDLISAYRLSRSEDLFDFTATVTQSYFTCTKCLVSERIGEFSFGSMSWTLSIPVATQTCKVGERIWYSQLDCFEAELRPDSKEYRQRLLSIYKEQIEYCPETLTETSIEDSLKSYLRVSHMDSESMMTCSTCEQDTEHFKHTVLVRTGTVFVIHLQRYSDAIMEKDCSNVKVPMTLDLQPFIPGGGEYRLYVVISHIGTLKSGHFWVNLFAKGVWYKYNDYHRQAVKKEDVLNKYAYVLFYRKSCKSSTATCQ